MRFELIQEMASSLLLLCKVLVNAHFFLSFWLEIIFVEPNPVPPTRRNYSNENKTVFEIHVWRAAQRMVGAHDSLVVSEAD